MDTHPDIALLAPVPLVLLEGGMEICQSRKKVAFGSRAWELFEELDGLRDGLPVDTYIYASHTGAPEYVAWWHAYYTGSERSDTGAHSGGRWYRPRRAIEDGEDRAGYWVVFWEVAGLAPVRQPVPLGGLRGHRAKRDYGNSFVPEGPMIIEHP